MNFTKIVERYHEFWIQNTNYINICPKPLCIQMHLMSEHGDTTALKPFPPEATAQVKAATLFLSFLLGIHCSSFEKPGYEIWAHTPT